MASSKFRYIEFTDSLIGYSVGRCGTILMTGDGGANWSVSMQNTPSFCLSNPYAHDLRTIVMHGSVGVAAGAPGIGMLYLPGSSSPWSGNFFHIQKVPITNKFFTCTNQEIKISNDYGYSWSTVGNYSPNLGFLNFGYYIDPNNIYVCNGLKIFKYEWTGSSYAWVSKYNSTSFYINSLEFRNQQKGYFATSLGSIYYTNDGGLSWNAQNTFISTPLNRLFFVNDTSAWCVGDYGVILKYNSFTTEISKTENKESFLIFPNPTTGNFKIITSTLPKHILITNAIGEKILSKDIKQKSDLSFELFKNGIYLVKVITEKNSFTQKIIVN